MELIFVTEARFVRSGKGKIYSLDTFNNKLWERYLHCFERITVVARVLEAPDRIFEDTLLAESSRVSFLPLPYYLGMTGFLKKQKQIRELMKRAFDNDKAYILRVPGILGTLAAYILFRRGICYGVEVVGDPWDVFAPGAIRHPLRPVFRYVFTKALKLTVKKSAAALYVTSQTLQKRYPTDAGVFQVAASNVKIDDEVIASVPPKIVVDKCCKLVSVGSLAQLYKAPDVVIEAIAELQKYKLDCHLTWLGDGKYKEAMKVLAEKLNVAERIDFCGNMPFARVLEFVRNSDIFLLVSRTEGLPRALIEAMACGLPCIGSRVGGIPELLEPVALVAPGNSKELAEKIYEFVTDSTLLNSQAVRNWNEAKNYHDKILSQRRMAFYQHVINRVK